MTAPLMGCGRWSSGKTEAELSAFGQDHPRDEKQLAAWNGLMLSALVDAVRVLDDQRYREAARRLRDFATRLWDGRRLQRARGYGGELGSAALEDYVYVAGGLHDWAQLTGSGEDLHFHENCGRGLAPVFPGERLAANR